MNVVAVLFLLMGFFEFPSVLSWGLFAAAGVSVLLGILADAVRGPRR